MALLQETPLAAGAERRPLEIEHVFCANGEERKRSIGTNVIQGTLNLRRMTVAMSQNWRRNIRLARLAKPGSIDVFHVGCGLDEDHAVQSAYTFLRELGVNPRNRFDYLACRGASFHTDAFGFGSCAFCVVWLSEDAGWDLYFPQVEVRVELKRGKVILFDAGIVHGVVRRGAQVFEPGRFEFPDVECGSYMCTDMDLFDDPDAMRIMGARELASTEGMVELGFCADDGVSPVAVDELTGEMTLVAVNREAVAA